MSFRDFHAIAQKHRDILQARSVFEQSNRKAISEHVRMEFDPRDFSQALERSLPIRDA
jgi:hypothetical protein